MRGLYSEDYIEPRLYLVSFNRKCFTLSLAKSMPLEYDIMIKRKKKKKMRHAHRSANNKFIHFASCIIQLIIIELNFNFHF